MSVIYIKSERHIQQSITTHNKANHPCPLHNIQKQLLYIRCNRVDTQYISETASALGLCIVGSSLCFSFRHYVNKSVVCYFRFEIGRERYLSGRIFRKLYIYIYLPHIHTHYTTEVCGRRRETFQLKTFEC